MKARFEIKEATDGKFMFNLKSANDQVILTSQLYETKESARAGIASVMQNAPLEERYEEKSGAGRRPYFVLIAANKQVIGRSQMYSSREAMRKGIASVKRNAPIAETVDLSARVRTAGGQGSGAPA
jgi:uncharacterized protein YegP (UPF0339 family)